MAEQKELIVKDDHGVEHNLYNLPKGFVFEGSIRIWDCNLEELPDLSDVTVTGDFCCGDETLTSLKGSPKEVGGMFSCFRGNLKNLEGAPKKVGGSFRCGECHLISLEGAPEKVGGEFYCEANNLKTLKGAPKEVGGDFRCSFNDLESLEGAPEKVGGDFRCTNTYISSLKGAPKEVGGSFYCYANQLTSLEGAPENVGGVFGCDVNPLISLYPLPKCETVFSDENLLRKYTSAVKNNCKTHYQNIVQSEVYQREKLILEGLQKTRAKIDAKHETDTPSQAQEPKTNSQVAVTAQMIQDKKVQSM